MTSVVKHLRSTTAGHTPSSLVSGQIALNEADGKVFWLDADGTTIRSVTVKGLDTAVAGKLTAASNLSDLANASTARTNLGLGSSATLASSAVAQTSNNLSDLANAGTARTNLGLGSAATLSSSSVCQTANNLSDVANPSTARGNLGIAIGTNVQAWDADLDAIAALSGTSGLLKKTAANTWALDTTTYLSGSVSLTSGVTGILPVANGGTNASSAGITAFNNITGYTASGATGTTSTNLVFSTSPILTTPTATGLKETKTAPSISSGTLTLDCSTGNVFAVSLNANITTLSFTNVPSSGTAYGLTLALTANGSAYTVTWGSAVKWPSGTAPTLTSTNGKVDTFVLTTWDGGTNWYAFVGGQNA